VTTIATIPGPPELLPGRPDAIVDLQTLEGAALVDGQWRYSDTQVRETGFVSVGPDLGPSGPPNRTYEIVPHAQAADFDDSAWAMLSPEETQRLPAWQPACDQGRAARQHHRPGRQVRRQAAEQPQRPRVRLGRGPVLHRPAIRAARQVRDPKRELPFSGVFRVRDGVVSLITPDLAGPSGIALSPDERHLYVGNWDLEHKVVMRYAFDRSGSVTSGEVFFDATGADGEDAIDGIKVDTAGHVYVCGPGGIWVLSPDGEHLGTLRLPESPHNVAWGDEDARTLYITALTSIYRIRLAIPGVRPA
jgi:SMP-30/Gluconolactonase/LRE-like region